MKDLKNLEDCLDDIINEASSNADDKLAGKISSLTRLTEAQIRDFFPEPSDIKKLAELMTIVKGSEDKNTKIQNLLKNSEKFGSILITLLSRCI